VSPFNKLLSEHIGAACARQLTFADFLGERNWSVDIGTGKVGFGDDLEYPIQLLGSESHISDTWLWSWANEHIDPAPETMAAGAQLRALGEQSGIEELAAPNFSLDAADGHTIAAVASGIYGRCCYYRGPYDGGALFFLVTNVPDSMFAPVSPERAITALTQVISIFDVDHWQMARSFLTSQGFNLREDPQAIAASRDGGTMTLSFDELGRLTGMDGQIGPRPASAKKWWGFGKP
jgi:hypothetical protein